MLEPTPLYGETPTFSKSSTSNTSRSGERRRALARLFRAHGAAYRRRAAAWPIQAEIAQRARTPRAQGYPRHPLRALLGADNAAKQAAVSRLIQIWTNRGHLVAKVDPLGLTQRPRPRVLDLGYFGLAENDLDTEFFTGSRSGAVPKRMKLRDILAQLEFIYAGTIGAEFAHVSNPKSGCGCRISSRPAA